MSDIDKIGGDNTTSLINKNGNTSIEQNANISNFENFQKEVARKSLCKRAIGVVTGVFGGAGAAVGGIFAIKVGIAAMVRALAGLVGAAAAPFVLIGMGALCIAAIIGGIVFFVKNRKENIYIKELNKLLQNDGVENKKQAISYLNEMISKHKKGSVEYNATVRFLNENTEIFKLCLESKDRKLFDGITKFLTGVSKNKCEKTKYSVKKIIADCLISDSTELNTDAATLLATFLKDNDTKSLVYEIIEQRDFSLAIQGFLKSNNNDLKTNTIGLLYEMLKNGNTKSVAEGIVKGHIKSDNTRSMDNAIKLLTELLKDGNIQTNVVQIVKNCLGQGDSKLRSNAIKLLTNMLKSEDTNVKNFVKEFFKEENIDLDDESEVFTEKIGNWMKSGNNELKANTIRLLAEMLKSKSTDLASITKKIITGEDFIIEGQSFADIIKSWLRLGDDRLKINIVELLNEMLVGSDDELKKKSREILKSDVLNTKGMLNIFLNDRGIANEEAISLLKPMCKDKEIKNTLSDLIGKDLVEKLEGQENDIKSDDVVNVLYENIVVKGIFSEGNKKHIIDLLKDEDGLHNVDINFDENEQITKVKKEKQKSFFKGEELNLKALKEQSIKDFSRDLKSIKTANGRIINAEGNRTKNEEFLEKIFEDAGISEDAKDLIYKFPGQSAWGTRSLLVIGITQHLGGALTFNDTIGSKLNSCGITVNTDGSVEVQMRRIGIISTGPLNLPMAIEEVHTFKINKGEDTYKTTNAKITVYKLESTSIQLTEENLKDQDVLSQVSYNRDEDNNENNKKA